MAKSESGNRSSKTRQTATTNSVELDLSLLADSLGYALRLASFFASQRFHEVMRPFHLRPAHFSTLVLIAANPGVKQKDLCETLRIEKANFVGLLDALERRKLVERRAEPKDRRRYAIHLTKEGQTLLRRASRVHAQMEEELRKRLPARARKELLANLERFRQVQS
jgi:DNA-binding MarR family transcriptional regulator